MVQVVQALWRAMVNKLYALEDLQSDTLEYALQIIGPEKSFKITYNTQQPVRPSLGCFAFCYTFSSGYEW